MYSPASSKVVYTCTPLLGKRVQRKPHATDTTARKTAMTTLVEGCWMPTDEAGAVFGLSFPVLSKSMAEQLQQFRNPKAKSVE